MIIFDLDGTLADCEHRRHFVRPPPVWTNTEGNDPFTCNITSEPWTKWKPDWKSFYEACDKDSPIEPTILMIRRLHGWDYYDKQDDVHIWSGREESTRAETEKWLNDLSISYNELKMRPMGDSTPDDVLKEKWLDEALSKGKKIEFVFDDRPKVIRMWRRRGIFVFNCCQHNGEF